METKLIFLLVQPIFLVRIIGMLLLIIVLKPIVLKFGHHVHIYILEVLKQLLQVLHQQQYQEQRIYEIINKFNILSIRLNIIISNFATSEEAGFMLELPIAFILLFQVKVHLGKCSILLVMVLNLWSCTC